ncbi:MAG: iron-containing alcohol dehydrogenase [Saccharofermentans sp.]|nr:iron-containing alcohol dehydrogenase [Saccharofermentans sp.]
MDRLEANRNYDCFCGNGIASEFVAGYILEKFNLGRTDLTPFKVAIVSDRQVSGYYYNQFESQFLIRNIKPQLICCEATESSKSLKSVHDITFDLTEAALGAGDWIIALGGGGVLDCASFAQAVYGGGAGLILVPTTLSSMAESTVADIAYLNSGKYKDAVRTEVSPEAVFVDPSFLKTVPSKYKNNGFAPIIRLAVLIDTDLINGLITEGQDFRIFLNRVYSARSRIESKNPQLLTLGSEIAHAIEGYFRFMNYSEGQALALSLYSCMPEAGRQALGAIYAKLGLPTKLEGVAKSMIMKSLDSILDRKGEGPFSVVDYDNGKWAIRSLDKASALGLFSERLDIIC